MKQFIPHPFGPWAAFYKATGPRFGVRRLDSEYDYGITGAVFGRGFVLAWRKNLDKQVAKRIDWEARGRRNPLPERYRKMLFRR